MTTEPAAASMDVDADGQSTQETDLLRRSADKWKEFTSKPAEPSAWSLKGGAELLREPKRHALFYNGDGEDEGDIADFIKIAEDWRGHETDDDPIEIPVNECVELWRPWRRAVIVKVLGRNVSYRILHQKLTSMWCTSGALDIVDLDLDYYVVRFGCKEDYENALSMGPWTIQGYYLTVRKWRPFFQPSKQKILSTLVWVRFPGVPLELFEKEDFLLKLASRIGKPGKVDIVTSLSTRAKFVRICVEMNLQQALRSKVVLNGNSFAVEYEGLKQICFHCGKLGHNTKECPLTQPTPDPHSENVDAGTAKAKQPDGPTADKPFGPWMIATNRKRRPNMGQRPRGSGYQENRQPGDYRDANEHYGNGNRQFEGQAGPYDNGNGRYEGQYNERNDRSYRQDFRTGSRFDVLNEEGNIDIQQENGEHTEEIRHIQCQMDTAAGQFRGPNVTMLNKDQPAKDQIHYTASNMDLDGINKGSSQHETSKRKGGEVSNEKAEGVPTKRATTTTWVAKIPESWNRPLNDISNGQQGQSPRNRDTSGGIRHTNFPGGSHVKFNPPDSQQPPGFDKQLHKEDGRNTELWKLRDEPPDDQEDRAVNTSKQVS